MSIGSYIPKLVRLVQIPKPKIEQDHWVFLQ